jgi:hypothetical protein
MSVASRTATPTYRQWAIRMLGSGLLAAALLTSVTATGANAAGGLGVGANGVGVDGDSEPRVAAIAASGLVRISTEWSGNVQYDTASGTVRSDPITASTTCSGFVANGDGHIVTAGHCVDPQDGRLALIHELVAGLVNSGTMTDAEAAAVTPHAAQSWVAEGITEGSPIGRRMSVTRTDPGAGSSIPRELTASVVDLRSVDEGDVALLQVQTDTPLPALRVAQRDSDVGAQIAVMGYPSGSDGVVDPSLAPTFVSGRTSARQSGNGLPFLQLDVVVPGMSGAPVVDAAGDVVGLVSATPLRPTEGFTFASAAETVGSMLSRNGVDSTLAASDRSFRDGLTSYFDGDLDGAVASFDEVLAVVPDHPLALEFSSRAAQSLTDRAGNRVGGNKSSGVAGSPEVALPVQPAASAVSAEVPSFIWFAGIGIVLMAAVGLVAGGLHRRSGRSGKAARAKTPRVQNARVQKAVRAASLSGNEPTAMTVERRDPFRSIAVGPAPRRTTARRGAVPARVIPADLMCTTVPPDLMRTTVCPELLQTTVMR